MPPHIVIDISGHGYGHAAMTLPVGEALTQLLPGVRLTVRSSLPERWLRARLDVPFDYRGFHDFGMAMTDGLHVDEQKSLDRYTAWHNDWPGLVARTAGELKDLDADLLVSNISYLSLAAARGIGLDRVAYSSLNWADVFWAYCGGLPGSAAIRGRMIDAYAAADLFLQPQPSMPMPSIRNGLAVGPVARLGQNRRSEIIQTLSLTPGTRLALLSLGGVATPIDFSAWPRLARWRVIVGDGEQPGRPDVTSWSELGMPFIDVLASADVLAIKPGYGLVTEGVCNGKPLLYVPRDRWPETEAEVAWVSEHGRGARIEERALRTGTFLEAAEAVMNRPSSPPPRADGAREVAEILLARL
ncbi:MAG: hypothetical protein ABI306_08990 [Caulobacteraceae bacterium]